jgi:F-type H+-transporting ATPase subunit gamma
MAVDTKAIKQQIKSVGNIRKVTKTMEMISIAKMKRAVEHRKASEKYAKLALSILSKISNQTDITHPLFSMRKYGKNLLVIIASDKGLCGPFNSRVEKMVMEFQKENVGTTEAITIGLKAKKIAKKCGIEVLEHLPALSDHLVTDDISPLIDKIKNLYVQDETYKTVNFIYTEFISSLLFKVRNQSLLPLNRGFFRTLLESETEKEKKDDTQYIFEPSRENILEEVLPALIQVGVFQFALESVASEHSSRMLAMRNASDNASRMKDKLTGEYNRARQAGITKEIIEIINAAQAV